MDFALQTNDKNKCVFACKSNEIYVYNYFTHDLQGKLKTKFDQKYSIEGNTKKINKIMLSNDGNLTVTIGRDEYIRLFNNIS